LVPFQLARNSLVDGCPGVSEPFQDSFRTVTAEPLRLTVRPGVARSPVRRGIVRPVRAEVAVFVIVTAPWKSPVQEPVIWSAAEDPAPPPEPEVVVLVLVPPGRDRVPRRQGCQRPRPGPAAGSR
jgi:hypothetical protein